MILDKLSNQDIYKGLHKNFPMVFDFIKNNDLRTLELGKHTIDEDNVFVVVMEYDTQDISECKSETHLRYIDIQYMIFGEEYIGVTNLKNEVPTTPYDEKGDFMFYSLPKLPQIKLTENHFAVFFKDDIHQTMIKVQDAKRLRKAVFKILK